MEPYYYASKVTIISNNVVVRPACSEKIAHKKLCILIITGP